MKELIIDIKKGKPIRVYLEDLDMGIFTYNPEHKRYEGIGYLTFDFIKEILKEEPYNCFIKIERVDN